MGKKSKGEFVTVNELQAALDQLERGDKILIESDGSVNVIKANQIKHVESVKEEFERDYLKLGMQHADEIQIAASISAQHANRERAIAYTLIDIALSLRKIAGERG